MERIWKEKAVGQFKVLSRHSPGETEEYNENPQSAGFRAKFWAQDLPSTKQEI
jgi:hypothetical protein